jgi:hypothetical protein
VVVITNAHNNRAATQPSHRLCGVEGAGHDAAAAADEPVQRTAGVNMFCPTHVTTQLAELEHSALPSHLLSQVLRARTRHNAQHGFTIHANKCTYHQQLALCLALNQPPPSLLTGSVGWKAQAIMQHGSTAHANKHTHHQHLALLLGLLNQPAHSPAPWGGRRRP